MDMDIIDFCEQYLSIQLSDFQKVILRKMACFDCNIVMPYKRGYTAAKDQSELIKIMLDTMKG